VGTTRFLTRVGLEGRGSMLDLAASWELCVFLVEGAGVAKELGELPRTDREPLPGAVAVAGFRP
jgi:hypothetical protein